MIKRSLGIFMIRARNLFPFSPGSTLTRSLTFSGPSFFILVRVGVTFGLKKLDHWVTIKMLRDGIEQK